MISILDDIRKIESGTKELREFGITMGTVLMLLAGLALWRGRPSSVYFLIFGLLFIGFGLIRPAALKPLQKVWMAFSVVMGFFMSRVILIILFYLIITPISVMLKIFGKDVLDKRIRRDIPSYWRELPVKAKTKESYENQY